jgi:hypothetical protein
LETNIQTNKENMKQAATKEENLSTTANKNKHESNQQRRR